MIDCPQLQNSTIPTGWPVVAAPIESNCSPKRPITLPSRVCSTLASLQRGIPSGNVSSSGRILVPSSSIYFNVAILSTSSSRATSTSFIVLVLLPLPPTLPPFVLASVQTQRGWLVAWPCLQSFILHLAIFLSPPRFPHHCSRALHSWSTFAPNLGVKKLAAIPPDYFAP